MNTEKIRELLELCEVTESDWAEYRLAAVDAANREINLSECLSHKINAIKKLAREALLTPEAAEGELVARITEYLSLGGLHNPELANHDKVRDLLIDCRAALTNEPAKLKFWRCPYCKSDVASHDWLECDERTDKRVERLAKALSEPAPDSPVDLGALIASLWLAINANQSSDDEGALYKRAAIALESLTKQLEGHEGAWRELAEHATIRQFRGMQEATIRVDCATFPLAYPKIKDAIARLKAKGEK